MSARAVQEERCVSDKVCGSGRFVLLTTFFIRQSPTMWLDRDASILVALASQK